MKTFWQSVAALAAAYDRQGLTTPERIETVMAEFRGMSPTIRRLVLADARRIAVGLSDVVTVAEAVAEQLEAKEGVQRRCEAG
jgi:hypothetical protein